MEDGWRNFNRCERYVRYTFKEYYKETGELLVWAGDTERSLLWLYVRMLGVKGLAYVKLIWYT